MSETLQQLRSMSLEELIAKHDGHAGRTAVGTSHYLTEIARRDDEAVQRTVLRYTRWITIMTLVMTAATVINVAIAYR